MTQDQLNQKYYQLCAELGDAYFKSEQLKVFIDLKMKEMQQLEHEAKKLQQEKSSQEKNKQEEVKPEITN